MGIGFGYNDGLMTGGAKAVVIDQACNIGFHAMVDHQSVWDASSGDPWSSNPGCVQLTPTLLSISLRVGGDYAIVLPSKGTKMFVFVAGGRARN